MNLASSVLALALVSMDDSQPNTQEPPSPAFTIEFKINAAQAQVPACQQVSAAAAEMPPTSAKPSDPSPCCSQAHVLSRTLPMPFARMTKPRTINDPQRQETWPMTLEQAIRIGLDNSEIVRVIAFGAQGIPIGGFEPTPLIPGAGAGVASALGCGTLEGAQGMTLSGQTAGPPVVPKSSIAPTVIARLYADSSIWRFKAEVMAHLRSIEQQYWNLTQAHVQLESVERAVSMVQEILIRELAEQTAGGGTFGDVAKTAQRLEQFELDRLTRTSDVITTERQLRNILGLPSSDNRRIIPVTPPTEPQIVLDWDTCLDEMLEEQPDIVQQDIFVRLAELQLLLARNRLTTPSNLITLYQLNSLGQGADTAEAVMMGGVIQALKLVIANERPLAASGSKAAKDTSCTTCPIGFALQLPNGTRSPLANTRQAQYTLLRSRAYRRQLIHQTTHSLARFFLEMDANYKQYQTAQRLRAGAAQRLDAERADYEIGRITIDCFLDAISQFTTAVATEHQYLATYNISLAALSEAKGTLLADRNIVLAEGPRATKSWQAADTKTDDRAKTFRRRLMALGYFRRPTPRRTTRQRRRRLSQTKASQPGAPRPK